MDEKQTNEYTYLKEDQIALIRAFKYYIISLHNIDIKWYKTTSIENRYVRDSYDDDWNIEHESYANNKYKYGDGYPEYRWKVNNNTLNQLYKEYGSSICNSVVDSYHTFMINKIKTLCEFYRFPQDFIQDVIYLLQNPSLYYIWERWIEDEQKRDYFILSDFKK